MRKCREKGIPTVVYEGVSKIDTNSMAIEPETMRLKNIGASAVFPAMNCGSYTQTKEGHLGRQMTEFLSTFKPEDSKTDLKADTTSGPKTPVAV